MKEQARKMWLIELRSKKGEAYPEGILVVLAHTVDEATRKLQRYLGRRTEWSISKIEYDGTIDIF